MPHGSQWDGVQCLVPWVPIRAIVIIRKMPGVLGPHNLQMATAPRHPSINTSSSSSRCTVPRCKPAMHICLQWFYVDKWLTLSTCCTCQKAFYGRYHALACRTRYCFTNSVRPSVCPSHCGTVRTSSNFFPPPRVS